MTRRERGTCSFSNCGRPHYGKGYCQNHYLQLRNGQELHKLPRMGSFEERFWDRVALKSEEECWEWLLRPGKEGYAEFWHKGVSRKAHRVSFELSNGPIPPGKVIDHKCRNKLCVNPDHLHAVTHKENTENLGLYKNNPSGYRGVTRRESGKWRARVGHFGKVITVGEFDTPEEANEAVVEARRKLHTNNWGDREGLK